MISGPCRSSGFFGNKALNDEHWVDGWYPSGNLGRFDEQGNLFLLGRKRDTIIRGGQNIYPIEIESLLVELSDFFGETPLGASILPESQARWIIGGVLLRVAQEGQSPTHKS